MSGKHGIQVTLFVVLLSLAVHNGDTLYGTVTGNGRAADIRRMQEELTELDALEEMQSTLLTRLENARSELREASTSFLPDPSDPFAWATLQVRFLEQESGIQVQDIRIGDGPRIRTDRDQENRQFEICRCDVVATGTMDQVLAFIRIAEDRNPHLVVSGLAIGPLKGEPAIRHSSFTLDWPTWRSTDLREDLLSELDELDGSAT